jgi:hypothetical protein
MLEILEFYMSGFWTWAGITIGMSVFMGGFVGLISGLKS